MSKGFSNGKTAVHVKTVADVIRELSLLPAETPVAQDDPGDGADIVLFNKNMEGEHVLFDIPGTWVSDAEIGDKPTYLREVR